MDQNTIFHWKRPRKSSNMVRTIYEWISAINSDMLLQMPWKTRNLVCVLGPQSPISCLKKSRYHCHGIIWNCYASWPKIPYFGTPKRGQNIILHWKQPRKASKLVKPYMNGFLLLIRIVGTIGMKNYECGMRIGP